MMKFINKILLAGILVWASACNKYLDVIPDNIATIDNAFTLRSTAERYLFTCYSYMPRHANISTNPAMLGGDELWSLQEGYSGTFIAKGLQNVVTPYNNYWDGEQSGQPLFRGIRDCNIFIENINKVREMTEAERKQWLAEAKVLKAYYHFWLFRAYGPIPLIRENLPVSAGIDEVQVYRAPVDECVDYIVQLLDEAAPDLPLIIQNQVEQMGRITQTIALSIKAQVLLTAASPLFNGNSDYAGFRDNRGTQLFKTPYDPLKWERALTACNEAIALCHIAGIRLYDHTQEASYAALSIETKVKMSIRNSVTKAWNTEIIWGNTLSKYDERASQPRFDSYLPSTQIGSDLAATLKMVELYYTDKGVPITEAAGWNYGDKLNFRTAENIPEERNYIRPGYTTVALHFNREPRFYASIGFDGGIWFGHGNYTETDNWYVQAKAGQVSGKISSIKYSPTGYWPKKLQNPLSVYSTTAFSRHQGGYPWPVIRLADLYLMYAEASNEVNGPGEDAYRYMDSVRKRAGLEGVVASWAQYSTNPAKPATKEGLRRIIQQERGIELAFEGHRFWDLRRWKTAMAELNVPVSGMDIEQSEQLGFYRPQIIFRQTFKTRDYFWPIKELDVIVNKNLVQNPGW